MPAFSFFLSPFAAELPGSVDLTANMNDLDLLVQSAETEFSAAATPADLENAKARFLGTTGRVTELL